MKYGKIIITLRSNIQNMKVFCQLKRYSAIIITSFCAIWHTVTAQLPVPKHEVRAVWLTTIGGLDWPHTYARSTASVSVQQRELCDILDKLKAANVNTVLLQTRVRGTVIYPSEYEPWDGCLSGVPGLAPGYDALGFAVEECHKRGMELHAWVVTLPLGKWQKEGCQRLRKKYPSMVKRIGDEGYMNPESAGTADYLARICREITSNYDIDGIHLDYIRYPETWPGRLDRERGRQNITSIVSRINSAVKGIKPWVKMSCSPVGKYDDLTRYSSRGWNARTKVCQDAQGWLRDGLMDELFPMMYFRGDQFYPFALDWKENSYGRIISIGLGIYFMSPKEKNWPGDVVERQMNVLRRHGLGHAYFRSRFFTDNVKGIYDMAASVIDHHPALIPPMTWQWATAPLPPLSLTVRQTHDGTLLTWDGAADRSGAPYLLYNVYASDTYPVNTDDARNLIATRLVSRAIFLPQHPGGQPLHFAVTAMDRYGNESSPILSDAPEEEYTTSTRYLSNDGRRLALPAKGQALDAEFVVVETLKGNIVAMLPYSGSHADISSLPPGAYVLKSLGRKGVAHRIGYFMKNYK